LFIGQSPNRHFFEALVNVYVSPRLIQDNVLLPDIWLLHRIFLHNVKNIRFNVFPKKQPLQLTPLAFPLVPCFALYQDP